MLVLVQDDRITSKLCIRCDQEKRTNQDPKISEFYYTKKDRRYESICRVCKSDYNKEYRKANRDKLLKQQKDARLRRLPHYRAVNRNWHYRRKEKT